MKKINFLAFFILISIFSYSSQIQIDSILKGMDNVLSAPHSGHYTVKLKIIDKKGNETDKIIEIYHKSGNKRVGKFLSPPADKGFGFLSLPNGEMYIYMPAYNKIKKIVTQKKNGKFAGTDFSYKDMEPSAFYNNYQCELLSEDSLYYIIKLTPNENTESPYKYSIVKVSKNIFYPEQVKYFNKNGKHIKTMTVNEIRKIDDYYIAVNSIMENCENMHKTIMIIENAEFDINLDDDIFTKRYLKEQ